MAATTEPVALNSWRSAFGVLAGNVIIVFAQLITAVRAVWAGSAPTRKQRIYFANHCSHGDLVLIWTVLPAALRRKVRPVAGSDYWLASGLRRFIGCTVFNAVLIDRNADSRQHDPVGAMTDALDEGSSLILFPEGTRNLGDAPLQPFKSGLFHLASRRPDIELVPVWIENLNRVMPKGEWIPLPLICRVIFGAPLLRLDDEDKASFLQRAAAQLLALDERQVGKDASVDGASDAGRDVASGAAGDAASDASGGDAV